MNTTTPSTVEELEAIWSETDPVIELPEKPLFASLQQALSAFLLVSGIVGLVICLFGRGLP